LPEAGDAFAASRRTNQEDLRLHVPDGPSDLHRQAVLARLSAFNESQGFPADSRPVAVLLQDAKDEIHGGLWGRTGYGWLFVEFLVVPDSLRGSGLGASLMHEAERIVAERGCQGAWLTTFTFQARGFYEKLGYSVFGRLGDSPAGNDRIFLSKRFADLA
jgi:GNAT superfamily N-acetyltransferase